MDEDLSMDNSSSVRTSSSLGIRGFFPLLGANGCKAFHRISVVRLKLGEIINLLQREKQHYRR